jgi:hypothetical protein
MKKAKCIFGGMFAVLLLASGAVAFGEPVGDVIIKAGETVMADRFAFTRMLMNDGTIKGDLIFLAQHAASSGTVEGDVIGGGQSVDLSGTILGNVRAAGESVALSGKVGKNVNAFGKTVRLNKGLTVGGSLVSGARTVIAGGSVRGNARLYAESVTLDGEFFGDVTINSGFENLKDENDRHPVKTKLTVLPGAVVHGTLTFTGSAADVSKDARIGKYDWKKTPEQATAFMVGETIWEAVRTVFMTVALMLLGLLLFRAFPSAFARIDDFAFHKPWNASAWGLAVIFSPVAALVLFILLLALSVLITPAFGLVFGVAMAGMYALLLLLSAVPAGMLVGRLIARNRSMTARLIIGLVVLNGAVLLFQLAGNIPVAGHAFNAIAFIIRFCAVMIGTGALAHAAKESMAAENI